MPAPFVMQLCGYREHGAANVSDASDDFSREISAALFETLGVPPGTAEPKGVGERLNDAIASDLRAKLARANVPAEVRKDSPLNEFEQFRHVGALRGVKPGASKDLTKAWNRLKRHVRSRASSKDRTRLEQLISVVDEGMDKDADALRILLEEVGSESLLRLDVSVSPPKPDATTLVPMKAGFSLKWSLRTDRAQDCRSQGHKMATLRRGRMPHFAAVTMEPRPGYLDLLCGGSGDVDCVYHLNLHALADAVDSVCVGSAPRRRQADLFHRLVSQRRLRDYDELVTEVIRM